MTEQRIMGSNDLFLYKVSAKHASEVYVAAVNQNEAVMKVENNEIFQDIDPSQMSVIYVDLVTV